MNYSGIIVGAAVFMIIGIFHPIVIKMEYYWGKKSWWALALAGIVLVACSILTDNVIFSTILGAGAFSSFWGIHELFSQEMRILRGWFPENPKRAAYYEKRRRELSNLEQYPSHKNLKEKTRF